MKQNKHLQAKNSRKYLDPYKNTERENLPGKFSKSVVWSLRYMAHPKWFVFVSFNVNIYLYYQISTERTPLCFGYLSTLENPFFLFINAFFKHLQMNFICRAPAAYMTQREKFGGYEIVQKIEKKHR